jgi:two-component system, cell cycle sensor histidine kinase and response regulator CckA
MILIVDDESESRKLMTAMLTDEGYQVNAADGGKLALASIAIRRPELILLDIRMPGMDGFEVCRRLKDNVDSRDIPLIFLSASGQLSERVEGFRLGAVDFVTKPFHREELLARLRTHLELGRLRDQLERRVAERTAELRESEERFRAMADAAPVMIWVAGTDKLCIFFNKGWLEFTGRSLEEELGNGWAEGVHPDDCQRCYSTYSSSFDERQAFQMEYRVRRADGEYRWVLDRGIPRFAANGVFAGYIGSCVDITDLKQDHDKMVAVQKLESLGVMAAGIAHDFGNLLAGICGEADVALSVMPPESPGRESVENVAALATHAAEIVNMVMASAGTGVDSNAVEPVDISFLVEQMLRLMTASVSKQARVRVNLAKDLPPVLGSVAQIRQVVLNLITNASEALLGQQGSITLTTEGVRLGPGSALSSATNLPAGNYVRLTVTDTGCGMSAETRARIFDQFFTTKSVGRGLGLAVVHGIVRSHGGAIRVVSAPLAGATFEILLPCAKSGRIQDPSPL